MNELRNFDKVGETAQTVVRTSQESANVMWDYVVRTQDLNTRLAQRTFETWLDALRRQTEFSRDMTQGLFERAEEQADAVQSLYGQWVSTFFSFPFSGFPYVASTARDTRSVRRQGMRLVETANASAAAESVVRGVETVPAGGEGVPIENYDELTVDEVVQRLGSLSVEGLYLVHGYEKRNKNRETLLHEIERKLSFPIEGYDEMNVAEISEQLGKLSVDELRTIRDYERRHKDRGTLLQEIERKLETTS